MQQLMERLSEYEQLADGNGGEEGVDDDDEGIGETDEGEDKI